jgi:hypothetical protein
LWNAPDTLRLARTLALDEEGKGKRRKKAGWLGPALLWVGFSTSWSLVSLGPLARADSSRREEFYLYR